MHFFTAAIIIICYFRYSTITMSLLLSRCAYCGLEGLKLSRCGKCSDTRYCSKDCQRSHWNVHRQSCDIRGTILEINRPPGVTPEVEKQWSKWKGLHIPMIQYLFAAVVNGTDKNVITMKLSYDPLAIPAKKFSILEVAGGYNDTSFITPDVERVGKYTGYYIALCPAAFGRLARTVPIYFESSTPPLYSKMNNSRARIDNETEHLRKIIDDATILNDSAFKKWLKNNNNLSDQK